jgi:phosphate acetyltransferase
VRIAFADASDERVLEAVAILAATDGVVPIVVDPPAGVALAPGAEALPLDDPEWAEACRREAPFVHPPSPADPDHLDAVLIAALYTRLGGADVGVAGSLSTSASVIRAGIRGVGLQDPDTLVSGAYLMHVGGERMTFADISVIPDPDASQLARIAVSAADCHALATGEEPRIAMLSFSTHGSAEHADVVKVREAVELVRAARPELCVDGELQFDVAVMPEVAARKCPGSTVAGRANVLVFPDLGAANIAYKITERLAGARAVGSFVLGLRRPWVDLSRGCSTQDIVDAALAAVTLRTETAPVS